MQFLYPGFLYALLALAVPVIIHLFYFRRFKKVYFTNVKFLKEVKEETNARRRLRNFLVLLSRLLAFAAIIFAFAQPFIPKNQDIQKGRKAVSIFVDNSFSMNALSEDVPLINQAKRKASQIVEGFKPDDRFQVLTHDFEGRHQRLVSQEDALSLIEEIKTSPAVKNLSQVLSRQRDILNNSTIENRNAFLISDFQKSITDINSTADSSVQVTLVPLQSVQEKNISIDSAWFDAPVQTVGQTNKLMVKVRNYSDEVAENVRLTLEENSQVKPIGTLSIPARSSVIDSINLTILRSGWQTATLAITDFPVQFDDQYYFSYSVLEKVKVLAIHEQGNNTYLNAAFRGLPYFELSNQNSRQLNYGDFVEQNLIVLNDLKTISSGLAAELIQYVSNGGNLMVFPSGTADLKNYQQFLNEMGTNHYEVQVKENRQAADLNINEFIFSDVFENQNTNLTLPSASLSYNMTNYGGRGEEPILSFRDGKTFLGKYKSGNGYVYVSAVPLDAKASTLPKSAEIFVPLLYKAAIASDLDQKIAYTIGYDDQILTNNRLSENELVYKLKGGSGEFIPGQRNLGNKVLLSLGNELAIAGFYKLMLGEQQNLATYGFNFNRKESDLAYFNISDLEDQIPEGYNILSNTAQADLSQIVGEQAEGITYWRWCIILALIFLGIESLLLRFWKA